MLVSKIKKSLQNWLRLSVEQRNKIFLSLSSTVSRQFTQFHSTQCHYTECNFTQYSILPNANLPNLLYDWNYQNGYLADYLIKWSVGLNMKLSQPKMRLNSPHKHLNTSL